MKHNSDTIKKYKRKMSFTDWVLEQQEQEAEQFLDQDVDEMSVQEEQAITNELLNKWSNK
jgi:hypothetical protein|tara:strand:- start:5229 stop:5408 length:180 start_codon:yes stop_codon:yes gene_type:complete